MPSLIEDQLTAILQILEKFGAAIQNLELRVQNAPGAGPGTKTPWGTVGDHLPSPLPAPPSAASWVPTFEQGHYKDHWGVKYPMSEIDFATAETAEEVRKRLNADSVFLHPKFNPNEDAEQRWLKFPDGTTINAGRVADNWLRAPEGQFPGVALAWAKTAVEQRKGL